MIQVWVNETEPSKNTVTLVEKVEKLTAANVDKEFKSFVIFIADKAIQPKLEKLAEEKKVSKTALCFLADGKDDGALGKYAINPKEQKFTSVIFVYRDRKVSAKFIDLNAEKDFGKVEKAVKELLQ